MATTTDEIAAQLRVWGWCVLGHDDLAYYTAERPEEGVGQGWWDHDAAHLDRHLVAYGDEPYHRPPDHWALPGVLGLRIQRDAEFWDIIRGSEGT